jgi:hypothetical protein
VRGIGDPAARRIWVHDTAAGVESRHRERSAGCWPQAQRRSFPGFLFALPEGERKSDGVQYCGKVDF